jgi:DDE family transposase
MSIEKLGQYFGAIEDPRCDRKVEHRLVDILVIAVCAVIACAESWEDIALYGRSKLAWLRTFLELPNGVPSHDTFRRVFRFCCKVWCSSGMSGLAFQYRAAQAAIWNNSAMKVA